MKLATDDRIVKAVIDFLDVKGEPSDVEVRSLLAPFGKVPDPKELFAMATAGDDVKARVHGRMVLFRQPGWRDVLRGWTADGKQTSVNMSARVSFDFIRGQRIGLAIQLPKLDPETAVAIGLWMIGLKKGVVCKCRDAKCKKKFVRRHKKEGGHCCPAHRGRANAAVLRARRREDAGKPLTAFDREQMRLMPRRRVSRFRK